VSSKLDRVHGHVADRAQQRWDFREQFLDTDRLRNINYGNLVLRREAHLFLTHGVIVSVLLLLVFGVVSANWNNLMAFTGLFKHEDKMAVQCYEIVTNVTQLPPPPPIAPPEPVKPTCTPVEAPPNVGKVKKVAEAPAEQTLATQKEIRQAIQQGAGKGNDGGAACDNTIVELSECSEPPSLLDPNSRPNYPEMARIAGISGRIFVRVLIGEDGRAMKAEIVKRVPPDSNIFDKEAVRFAMTTKFKPGKQGGKLVRVWMTIPVWFKLGEG